MTDEADKTGKLKASRALKSRDRGSDRRVKWMGLVGLDVGLKEKAGISRLAKVLNLKMSRDGLEPSTHWLKASCSTN
jgi:hypothetical protein